MELQPLAWWIDKGAELCGSERALARAMGVPYNKPHMWRSGKEPMSAESAALLADVLELDGDDARQLVALAIIDNPKNHAKRERLRRALFACWALGVAFALQIAGSELNPATAATFDGRHIGAVLLCLALMARRFPGSTWDGLRPRRASPC